MNQRRIEAIFFALVLAVPAISKPDVLACIWDADTLSTERKRSPALAEIILGEAPAPADPKPLRKRIDLLRASPREDDPAWWNDLAGAHIRLGDSQEAVKMLEPLLGKFPNDYGIHANLGTAYHLLGRYQDAEREIARDLEINPEAHFGLEKYHLALLQYLIRDSDYQREHVYVDELSADVLGHLPPQFLGRNKRNPDFSSLEKLDYSPPDYRKKWDLAADANFENGVVYIASLNPRQPAALVMLAVVSAEQHDYNLAASAFEKAISLGSPQSEILRKKAGELREYIHQSHDIERMHLLGWPGSVILLVGYIAIRLAFVIRRRRRNRQLAHLNPS